jgi:hypothetical protein
LILPVDFVLVLEKAECNGMDGGIAPALVEETTGAIEVVEEVFVRLGAEEGHVGDFKVGPEMAGGVAVGALEVVGPVGGVLEPLEGVVGMDVLRVVLDELHRLGPEALDGFRVVVEIDGEAVGLVVVLHPVEDVVVNVAEEVDFGLDPPVPPGGLEARVAVEEAAVPPAHLVVGFLVDELHALFLQDFYGFLVYVFVDP